MIFQALQPGFKEYQEQIVKNARHMAETLIEMGYDIVSGGTDTHLCVVNLRSQVSLSLSLTQFFLLSLRNLCACDSLSLLETSVYVTPSLSCVCDSPSLPPSLPLSYTYIQGLDGDSVEKVLELCSITVNKNTCPGDVSAVSPGGIRLGTPALTSREMKEDDIKQVTQFVHEGIQLTKQAKMSYQSSLKKGVKDTVKVCVYMCVYMCVYVCVYVRACV